MIEPKWLLLGLLLPALVSAGLFLILHSSLPRLAWSLSTTAGFVVGYLAAEGRPNWPPSNADQRLLLCLLPLALLAEILTLNNKRPRSWAAWLPRFITAASIAPIILWNSIYLSNLAGPNTRLWSPTLATAWLVIIAAAVFFVWQSISRFAAKSTPAITSLALTIASLGAGATIILSSSQSTGQLTLSLAASAAGIGIISLILSSSSTTYPSPGISIVTLAALLVIGRFFADLRSLSALLLLAAPLAAWLTETPPLRSAKLWRKITAASITVLIPVATALIPALLKFIREFNQTNDYSGY